MTGRGVKVLGAFLSALLLALTLGGASVHSARAAQDDSAAFDQLWDDITGDDPIVGPVDGELLLDNTQPEYNANRSLRVSVENFALHVEFGNPHAAADGLWRSGIKFLNGQSNAYTFSFRSDGVWRTNSYDGELDTGTLTDLDSRAGGHNTLDVLVSAGTWSIQFNDAILDTIELPERPGPGDISVWSESAQPDAITEYSDLTVWSSDPNPGPKPGVTTQDGDEQIFGQVMDEVASRTPDFGPDDGALGMTAEQLSLEFADVAAADFALHVEFLAPYTPRDIPWDVGVAFRLGQTPHFRFIVESTNHWFLTEAQGDAIQTGPLEPLDIERNGRTTIDLVAIGALGYVGVNGDFVATLDLSGAVGRGQIFVSTSFFIQNFIDGEATAFEAFTVWSLDGEQALDPGLTDRPTADEPADEPAGSGGGTVQLDEVDDSGVVGLAGLEPNVDDPDTTDFRVLVTGGSGRIFALVLDGDCGDADAVPIAVLTPLDEDGASDTTVNAELADLSGATIAVYDGLDDLSAPLACGTI
jgi:hypothetical protein